MPEDNLKIRNTIRFALATGLMFLGVAIAGPSAIGAVYNPALQTDVVPAETESNTTKQADTKTSGEKKNTEDSPQADDREEAAWEYRPYRVKVWLAHDDSWQTRALEDRLIRRINELAVLTDSSAWQVAVKRAPNPWNWRLLGDFDRELYSRELQADVLDSDQSNGEASATDKLVVVQINDDLGMFSTSVQEFDLRTGVWGPMVYRQTDLGNIESTVFESIKTAFMPITRIENVIDENVMMRVRAIGIAHVAERDEFGNWKMVANVGSPAWVGDNEIMLPVIRRNDRRGNLESIKPVEWTFLSIDSRDDPLLHCKIKSMRRVSQLGGRSGGRTERVALCIRAPNRGTVLKLISNDKRKDPLPDLMVYSRRTDAVEGDPNELLGKTDWRGQITIPPNDDSMRLILIRSGRRPLAQIPVVPGLYDELTATMPNDERRLYAEGVVRGLENELLDNVARRMLLSEQVKMALEKVDLDRAEKLLKEMRNVPDTQTFNMRLSREKKVLLFGDDRQREFIIGYFAQLEKASSENLSREGKPGKSDGDEGIKGETQLNRELQEAKKRRMSQASN